ncbi:hypothetical protein E2I00_012196, partial [Balaenoptera physalus]
LLKTGQCHSSKGNRRAGERSYHSFYSRSSTEIFPEDPILADEPKINFSCTHSVFIAQRILLKPRKQTKPPKEIKHSRIMWDTKLKYFGVYKKFRAKIVTLNFPNYSGKLTCNKTGL